MRKLGKLFLVYFFAMQLFGAAIGAFVAIAIGPQAQTMIIEALSCRGVF